MSKVVKCYRARDNATPRANTVPTEFTPTAAGLPFNFSWYGEWKHHDQEFTLKSDETPQRQTISPDGKTVYAVVRVPRDAPLGLYTPSRFEMRVGLGADRKTKEIDLNQESPPDLDVEIARDHEIGWPTIS